MTGKHLKIVCLLVLIAIGLAGRDAYPFCFEEAGEMYGINPLILR